MIYIDGAERINMKMYTLRNSARRDCWKGYTLFLSWLHTILVKLGLQTTNEDNTSGNEQTGKDKENEKSKGKKKAPKTKEGSKPKDTQERFMPQ
jgi:hypothetical protein